MWVYIALGSIALVSLVCIVDKLLMRYYQNRLEVNEAKLIEKKLIEIVQKAPGNEFYLSYDDNDQVWLTGVKQLAKNVPLPVWQRLLKLLMKSDKISIEFVMRRTPPVDIKLTTKKNPSN